MLVLIAEIYCTSDLTPLWILLNGCVIDKFHAIISLTSSIFVRLNRPDRGILFSSDRFSFVLTILPPIRTTVWRQ